MGPLKKNKIRGPWARAQCAHWLRRPCAPAPTRSEQLPLRSRRPTGNWRPARLDRLFAFPFTLPLFPRPAILKSNQNLRQINKKCYIRTRNRPVFIPNCSGVTESRDAAWRVLLAYVSRARQAASRDLVTPPWLYNRKFHRGDHWFQLWSRYPYRYKLDNKNKKYIVKGTPLVTIIATEIRYGIQKFRNRSVLVVGPHLVVMWFA